MSSRATVALVFIIVAMLGIVVIVGLVQKSLDTTGVSLALCALLAGTGGGIFARLVGGGGSDDSTKGGDDTK